MVLRVKMSDEFSDELWVPSVYQCFTFVVCCLRAAAFPWGSVAGGWRSRRRCRTSTTADVSPRHVCKYLPRWSGCKRPGRRTVERDADRAAGIGPHNQRVFSITGLMLKRCRATQHIPTKEWGKKRKKTLRGSLIPNCSCLQDWCTCVVNLQTFRSRNEAWINNLKVMQTGCTRRKSSSS